MKGQRDVAADGGEGVDGQTGHLTPPESEHAAEDGDGVVGGPQRACSGEEGGVLQDGEHLAALQLSVHLRPGDAGAGIVRDQFFFAGQPVDAGDRVVVRGDGGPR
ncbi:MAG TPA: hypothetical protein VGP04_17475 [Pseudonocardiaceae bacterium]|jgi:hypothetical protein|nr:hypothetical protein [Pseudonocardiaceae bacterium]